MRVLSVEDTSYWEGSWTPHIQALKAIYYLRRGKKVLRIIFRERIQEKLLIYDDKNAINVCPLLVFYDSRNSVRGGETANADLLLSIRPQTNGIVFSNLSTQVGSFAYFCWIEFQSSHCFGQHWIQSGVFLFDSSWPII